MQNTRYSWHWEVARHLYWGVISIFVIFAGEFLQNNFFLIPHRIFIKFAKKFQKFNWFLCDSAVSPMVHCGLHVESIVKPMKACHSSHRNNHSKTTHCLGVVLKMTPSDWLHGVIYTEETITNLNNSMKICQKSNSSRETLIGQGEAVWWNNPEVENLVRLSL